MNIKEILKSTASRLGDHKPRVIAEFLAIKIRGVLADEHLLPGDNKAFVQWARSQPRYIQVLLKQVFDGAGAVAHALPGGDNVLTLIIGEIASELAAQGGYVMTHADEQDIRAAVPLAIREIRDEIKNDPDKKSRLSRLVADLDEVNADLNAASEKTRRSREKLRKQRAARRARGLGRFL